MAELDWRSFLCCPNCKGPLQARSESLYCIDCGEKFGNAAKGVPSLMTRQDREHFRSLLSEEPAVSMQAQYGRRFHPDWAKKIVSRFYPPQPVYKDRASPPLPVPKNGLNLWIGGGGLRLPGWVNIDIVPVEGVDLVADAGNLPFRDGCCSNVACPALLEHVLDPRKVVSEIHRVLEAGGEFQAVVPFCHPYHAYPSDYARFSREGLIDLFGEFVNVKVGIWTGPTTTILTFLMYYAKLIFPVHGGNTVRRWLNRFLVGAFGWIIMPARYLDRWVNGLPNAHVLANHFYVSGRKQP
jgi:SAM-dependent methyltransferase/uncharacterized protein YbaR (Trm112 family)